MQNSWSPSEIDTLKDLVAQGKTRAQISQVIGRSPSSIKHKVVNLGITRDPSGMKSDNTADGPTIRYSDGGNTYSIGLDRTPIKSLDDVIKACNIDMDVWSCDDFEARPYNMGFVAHSNTTVGRGKGGREDSRGTQHVPGFLQLFSIKAKFKRRVGIETLKDVVGRIFERASEKSPVYKTILRSHAKNARMLEISLADHHIGKLAWRGETNEDYDVKIASSLFDAAVDKLLSCSVAIAGSSIDRIHFVVGNDLLQCDNEDNQTTSGTQVDTDSRYGKVLESVYECLVRAIEKMMTVADVHVIVVAGNHDKRTMGHVGNFLRAWFRNSANVTVDCSPKQRKVVEYGECLFMYTHGNEEKVADLPQILATENKIFWGRTTFRYIKIGHMHKKRVMSKVDIDEEHGVQTSIMPSLCASDSWHVEKGYVGNIRRSEAHLYSREFGEEFRVTVTAKELMESMMV